MLRINNNFLRKLASWSNLIKTLILLGVVLTVSLFIRSNPLQALIPNKIIIGLTGQPNRINPLFSTLNPVDESLVSLIYQPLITFDANNRPIGALAEGWDISEDGKTYTIHLKQNMKWHDDELITANDVAYTYNLTQENDYSGPEKPRFQGITNELIDDFTIKFTLPQPFSPFLETLSLPILPKHIWHNVKVIDLKNSKFNLQPIGSGDYKITKLITQVKPKPSIQEIWLELSSPRTDIKLPKELVIHFYENEEQLSTAFKLGEIDTFFTSNQNLALGYKDWKNTTVAENNICGQTVSLFYNLGRDKSYPTQDLELRKAIYLALSKSEFQNALNDSPLNKNHWAYIAAEEPHQLSDEQLRAIFESKTKDSPLTLVSTDVLPEMTIANRVFNALKDMGLNIKLELMSVDKARTETLPNHAFDLLLIRQRFGHDPDQYNFWHSSQTNVSAGGLNLSGYTNRQIDKVLEDGRKSTKEDERKEAYKTMQRRVYADLPAIFANYPPVYRISRINLKLTKPDKCNWYENDLLINNLPIE